MSRDTPGPPADSSGRHIDHPGRWPDRSPDRPKRVNPFDAYETGKPDYYDGDQDNRPDADVDDPGTGWYARAVRFHPDRPEPDAIHLPADRRAHVLDGDPWGGGHRSGTGRAGKTEFPRDWDDATAMFYIEDIAQHPDQTPQQQRDRRWKASGTREGVAVAVVVLPDARIWTAFPLPGSRGVVQNPRS